MDAKTGFFYLFSAVLLFAAFRVVTARNPVHAVLNLILAFSQAAAIWLLLKAEFLGIALVLVYLIGFWSIMRGIIEIDLEINPQYRLRLMVAHLKSKVFHSFGQAEMRRAEARLLNNRVRDALADENVNLLLVGDFNDTPSSAALRDISSYKRQRILHDLRPADAVGDAWTHRQNDDTYHRIDYMLASPGLLPEVVPEKTYAVRSPRLAGASDHRPLVATFVATERNPETAPDLSKRLPPEIPQND